MAIQVIKAEQWRGMHATLPELHLVLRDSETGRTDSNVMDTLCKSGIWHLAPSSTSDQLVWSNNGDFHTSRLINKEHPRRKDVPQHYSLKGDDGTDWKHSWFTWQDITSLPDLGEMVRVCCCFEKSGNIQSALFSKALVEAKIKEAGLDFSFTKYGGIIYTGPRDRVRNTNVYQNCNKLTWGIHFEMQAYPNMARAEVWGGACWPDKATVDAVAAKFMKDGTTDMCANLTTLKERFPDHPVVPKLAKWEREHRDRR